MSSPLQLASPSTDPSSSPKLPAGLRARLVAVHDPPSASRDPIWQAAVAAEARGVKCRLDDIWQDHVRGRLRAWWESVGPHRVLMIARLAGGGSGLAADEANIVARILSGDQQKCVACDLGLATSTVSGRYGRALDKLDLTRNTVPLPLILAAQAWVGVAEISPARRAVFTIEGQAYMVVSVPRADTSRMVDLTTAEREIAQWIIEGFSRFDIAHQRRTSVHTVARQFNAINDALRSTGRYALIRSATELGCFRMRSHA
jgi:DNA-binding CsgD family transcriptional regulator